MKSKAKSPATVFRQLLPQATGPPYNGSNTTGQSQVTKRAQTGEQIRILVAFLGATVLTLACYISNDNLKHVVLIIGVLMTLVWDGWQLKGDLFLLPAIFSIGAVISLRTAYPFGVALCTVS
jgi:hypothetical protein